MFFLAASPNTHIHRTVLNPESILKLSFSRCKLASRIADRSHVAENHLKLISCGSVIQDEASIHSQHIRQGSQVMVICLSQSEVEARQREEQASKLVKTKEAAAILAKRKDG